MSRSQTELNAGLQRDAAGPPERKPARPLIWLLLLLVALAAGAWWYMNRSVDTTPVVDTTPPVAQPVAGNDAASSATKPAKATAQRSERTPKTPVVADRTARLAANTPKPKYPPAALRANTGGTVTLDVQVDPQGEPLKISIAKRSGNRDLDRAALTAASHWHFEPAMHNGKGVAATVQVPVEFLPQ